MAAANTIYPIPNSGKRLELNLHQSLPYEPQRVALVCDHNPFYAVRFMEEQPWFCGLCFFRIGYDSEIPTRIHEYKTLASNGNPETKPKMVSHLHVVMGLKAPNPGERLSDFRKRRSALAREQYTARSPLPGHKLFLQTRIEPFSRPAPGLFPVTTALWKLMGYQPPLARVLIEGVNGSTEFQIAQLLETSVLDIYIRMAKAIRVGMEFIPNGDTEKGTSPSSRKRRTRRSQETGSYESGIDDPES